MTGVISIGSHWGEEFEGWLSQGCKLFLFFEPVKANFNKLKRLMQNRSYCFCLNFAIGDMNGEVEMFIETEHMGKSCSILEPTLHKEQYPDIIFHSKEIVDIIRLDDFMELDGSEIFRICDHLHIDTQGYEMHVLRGATRTLDQIKTINIEVYKRELYKDCAMFDDVDKFLTEKGFKLTSIYWRGFTWGDAKYERV